MALPSDLAASLTWEQVSAFRLCRHGLLGQPARDPVDVASRISGIHAQVMSCAELAIGLRTRGLRAPAVAECLWERRTLLKLWTVRGTLHLLPASEIDLWAAALISRRQHLEAVSARAYEVSSDDIATLVEAVRRSLDGRELTREELIAEVSKAVKDPRLLQHLRSGWGSLLKPASYGGYLCFGSNRGRNVTFTSPASIRGSWEPVDETRAVQEMTRRHLGAYGPVGHARFAVWWGARASRGREMFDSIAGELALVDVEGTRGYVLARDVPVIRDTAPLDSVLLLGGFDPYTVALCTHSQLRLDPIFKSRVSRTAGWISPVVLVNGRIVGVWAYRRRGGRMEITVDLFVKLPAGTRKRIGLQAERIGEFLDLPVELEFSTTA